MNLRTKKTVKFLAVGVFCILGLVAGGKTSLAAKVFTIKNDCNDPLICTQEVGSFVRADANVGANSYYTTSAGATCCQLSSKIQQMICDDGNDSTGVEVSCI